jgi:hypothetical protein
VVSDRGALNLQSDLTVSAWIRADDPSAYQVIADKAAPGAGAFRLSIQWGARLSLDQGTTLDQMSAPANSIKAGRWTHVAATRVGQGLAADSVKLYIDGELVAQGRFSQAPQSVAGSFTIGNDSYANASDQPSDSGFRGAMDELRVYDRVLDATEIFQLSWRAGSASAITAWPREAGGNDHRYQVIVFPNELTWLEAKGLAEQLGGHLATVTSAEENALIYRLVRQTPGALDLSNEGPTDPALDPHNSGPFLGGYQPPGSAEPLGGWQWVTGEPWSFQNWREGEPNDSDGSDYLSFMWGDRWNDNHDGGPTRAFVMEWSGPVDAEAFRPTLSSPLSASSQSLMAGEELRLSASVMTFGPAAYTWRRNGSVVAEGTRPELSLLATALDSGDYTVTVSNAWGAVTSPPVSVTVFKREQWISFPEIGRVTLVDGQVDLSASASSGLPVSFRLVSGPGAIEGGVLRPTGIGQVLLEASQIGNDSYLAAEPVYRTINVESGMGYSVWLRGHFSEAEMDDTGFVGPNADPDRDGLGNLVEYAFGSNPRVGDSYRGVELTFSDTEWIFAYSRPADRPDLAFSVQVHLEGGGWSDANVVHERLQSGDIETWRARCSRDRKVALFRIVVAQSP